MLGEAAASYAAADRLAPQPYLRINAAACRALAGEQAAALADAEAVLDQLAAGRGIDETPYWLAATRAEALLIQGEVLGADAALTEAMALDPDGYDDHASTLRQFGRLTEALSLDSAWLDKHRPPVSVHFAGHLGIAPDQSDALRVDVGRVLSETDAGFGYGALAAGSDIVVAEALIARGAALHVVLPAQIDDFEALSVLPYGAEWGARFRTCLAAAQSVHVAADLGAEGYEPLATALAADLAMGAAILNARRLESRAHQLLVIDDGAGPFGGGASTARDGETWAQVGGTQHVLVAPRTAPVTASSGKTEGHASRRLAALLAVSPTPGETASPAPDHVQSCGDTSIMFFSRIADATAHARALAASNERLCLSGHYGLIIQTERGVAGAALAVLDDVASMALEGTLTVSEDFATALQLCDAGADAQYVGDTPLRIGGSKTRLYTLTV